MNRRNPVRQSGDGIADGVQCVCAEGAVGEGGAPHVAATCGGRTDHRAGRKAVQSVPVEQEQILN